MKVQRVRQNDFATYGQMLNEDGHEECVVLERPWKHNAPDVSCIPATIDAHGVRVHAPYSAERYLSPGHNYVLFQLVDVPGRGAIELHIGCLPSDSKGCLLLGMVFGPVAYPDGRAGDGILASHTAFHAFMACHPEQRFPLDIVDVVA